MQPPIRITFRQMEPSPAVEERIRARAADLERFHHHITDCHVVVHAPHHHQKHGGIYHVRIDLAVPGSVIIVNREAGLEHAHEDVYVAIRDAFDAARRQLEDFTRRQRGAVKSHVTTND